MNKKMNTEKWNDPENEKEWRKWMNEEMKRDAEKE